MAGFGLSSLIFQLLTALKLIKCGLRFFHLLHSTRRRFFRADAGATAKQPRRGNQNKKEELHANARGGGNRRRAATAIGAQAVLKYPDTVFWQVLPARQKVVFIASTVAFTVSGGDRNGRGNSSTRDR